jgi:metal-responsive CopG/Arc/MetJ family transcriptional regulator
MGDVRLSLGIKMPAEIYEKVQDFFKENPGIKRSYFYADAILEKMDRFQQDRPQ